MNKAELISVVAESIEGTKKEATDIIDLVVDAIVQGAKTSGECVVPGLGKLVLTDVAERSGNTLGKAWTKPAHQTLKFKLSKAGKELTEG